MEKEQIEALIGEHIVAAPLGLLLGTRLEHVEPDEARVRLPYRDQVTTMGSMVHGGAIAALIDVTATAAAWSRADLSRSPRGTTVGLTVSYLSGAHGCDLVATGRVVQRGRSLLTCDVEVTGDSGAKVARALVTYKLTHAGEGG